jgi:hypothetical protein
LLGLWITILLCHAEINHVNNICSLRAWPAYQKVVWFDVAVDQVALVNRLYSRQLFGLVEESRFRYYNLPSVWQPSQQS